MKKVLQLKKGGPPLWKGDFNWEDLKRSHAMGMADLRFTLYDWDTRETECIFFDIDNIPTPMRREAGASAMSTMAEIWGSREVYAIDTGGGIHLYYPLDTPLKDEDFVRLRPRYREWMKTMSNELKGEGITFEKVDDVFSRMKLGRIPRSFNSRRREYSKLLFYSEGDKLPLNSIQEGTAPVVPISSPRKAMSWIMPDAVIRECRAIQDFKRSPSLYKKRSPWWELGQVYLAIGRFDEFEAYSRKGEGYDEQELIKMREDKVYTISCKKMREKYIEEGMSYVPCMDCVHRKGMGARPLSISGPLPCPTRASGFFVSEYDKDSKLKKRVVNARDVHNHLINVRGKQLGVTEHGQVYIYDGTKWNFDICLADIGTGRGGRELRNLAFELPDIHELSMADMNRIDLVLKKSVKLPSISEDAFDSQALISFQNTAFRVDMDKKEVIEVGHRPQNYNRHVISGTWDAKAKAPKFNAWFDFICDGREEMREVLQIIMGLTISGLTPFDYQKFFWLYGGSGTGKGTFTKVLNMLAESSAATIPSKFNNNPHEMPDMRGKLLITGPDYNMDSMHKLYKRSLLDFIRTVTGEELYLQKLVREPAMNIRLVGTLVLTSNDSFDFMGREEMRRRCVPIEFYAKPSRRVIGKYREFKGEMQGIYVMAVEGLRLWMEKGLDNYSMIQEELDEVEENINFEGFELKIVKMLEFTGRERDRISNTELYGKFCDMSGLVFEEKYKAATMRRIIKALAAEMGVSRRALVYKSNSERGVQRVVWATK